MMRVRKEAGNKKISGSKTQRRGIGRNRRGSAHHVLLSLGRVTLLMLMAGRVALIIGIVTFPAACVVATAVAFAVKFGIWLLLILRIVLFMVGAVVAFVAFVFGGVVVHPATQNIPTAARQTRQRIMRFLGDIALHPVPVVRAGIPLKIVRTRHLCITI